MLIPSEALTSRGRGRRAPQTDQGCDGGPAGPKVIRVPLETNRLVRSDGRDPLSGGLCRVSCSLELSVAGVPSGRCLRGGVTVRVTQRRLSQGRAQTRPSLQEPARVHSPSALREQPPEPHSSLLWWGPGWGTSPNPMLFPKTG